MSSSTERFSLFLYRRLRRRVIEIRQASSGERWFRADAIQLRLRDRIQEAKRRA